MASIEQQKLQLIQQALAAAADLVHYDKLDEAENVYKGILQHAPLNSTAMYNLGAIAHRRLDRNTAEQWFERAHQINPSDMNLAAALGLLKIEIGKKEEAARLIESAMKKAPSAEILYLHSAMLTEEGKMAEAEKELDEVIKREPRHVNALYNISLVRSFREENDKALGLMLALEKDAESLSAQDQTKLKFAIAKAFYDLKDYDNAFARYADGNKIKRSTYVFDSEWGDRYFDRVINLWTKELADRLRDGGNPSDKPIFIIGLPRSGSTLIEQILASHPHVFGGQELDTFVQCLPLVKDPDLPPNSSDTKTVTLHQALLDKMTPETLQKIGADYLCEINKLAPDSPRLTDKMLFNFFWLGLIRSCLPNAKIVHSMRDPVDSGISIYRQLFNQPLPYAYDLRELGKFIKGYQKIMRHWNDLYSGEFIDVKYEDMVADTENQAHRLLDFCNLEWDDACLRFYETDRKVNTASMAQVRRPIYRDSVKAWKKFEKYVEPLIDELEKP